MQLLSLLLAIAPFLSIGPVHAQESSDLLRDFPGQGALPELRQATVVIDGETQQVNTTVVAAEQTLNLNNIQGDILIGMKKLKERFLFFTINNAQAFKGKIPSNLVQHITTTAQLLNNNFSPDALVNVAFSASGLRALGVPEEDIQDFLFSNGQFADLSSLGDTEDTWKQPYKGTSIHGVFLVASDNVSQIDAMRNRLDTIFSSDWTVVHTVEGSSRPGSEAGHEHFGYLDGISQPAVNQFTTNPLPGQTFVEPGTLLFGHTGDFLADSRPAWVKDGSLMAFRELQQFVPEFNKFLLDNRVDDPGLTPQQGADLLGARIVGRWKSGAPIDLAPTADDPALGTDPLRNNNFDYTHPEIPGFNFQSDQTRCPFSAHIRKTRPRADLNAPNNHIMRAGIPYGPEVTPEEAASQTTTQERGLAFVSYQAFLSSGFHFMQQSWANNEFFIFGKSDPTPGFDGIIGQNSGQPRPVSGLYPLDPNRDLNFLVQHVVSRGGEYFFIPSISALSSTFAA